MPLERFIPKSPDPNIRNSQDFEVAKFGHLNTIIEYVNTYVAADSLQLAGTGPLTSTARYITDSLGNASAISISTIGVGIGTTNATARLRVISADTNGIAEFFQNGSTGSPLHLTRYGGNVPINLNTSGGTSTSPTPLVDGAAMSRITTNTYNGTAFGTSARIEVVSKGIQSATNYGSNMRFFVTAENSIATSEVLSILSSGNVQINESYVNDRNAKLFIKGSGSTSATTSLLVQNSGGFTTPLKTTDDGTTYVGWDSQGDFNSIFSANGNVSIGRYAKGLNYTLSTESVRLNNNNFQFIYGSMYAPNASILSTGSAGFGVSPTLARLQVRGSGSTSATTSLLVQNSSGSEALKVTDDRTITTTGTLTNLTTTAVLVNGLGLTASSMGGYTGCAIYRTGGGEGQVDIAHYNAFTSNGLTIREFFGTGQVLYTLATKFELRILGGFTTANGNNTVGNTLWMEPIYNITGQTGTIVRGIYYNPTLTSLTNTKHYGIQTTSGGAYINTATPNDAACLQADSTTQGFLPPRMTTTQRTGIVLPAAGLIVYDTDTNKSYTYDGTAWQAHW